MLKTRWQLTVHHKVFITLLPGICLQNNPVVLKNVEII